MFGLMRPEKKCGKSCHDWTRVHRMHYCGTCKAIGTQYGHQARLFLNFDIVFLSELLSDLTEEEMTSWTDAYQAINHCFSMPQKADETPFPLQYTATANTILSALKVDDNIKDQKQWRWYAAQKFYARSFRKAFEQMEVWGTPKEDFFYWIDLQSTRENSSPKDQDDLLDYLTFYAEPTAELTALIFEKGIEKVKPSCQQSFRNLGYHFGLLMYILDAFEDLENDIFNKEFNPLIYWFDAKKTLNQDQLVDVRHIILQLQHQVCEAFKALPLKRAETYRSRLVSNIALRIYRDRYIPTTRKERLLFRWNKAKELSQKIICDPTTNFTWLKYYLVTSSIFLMPRLVNNMPQEADKIDWEWSAFWSTVLPFSAHSNSQSQTTQKDKEEQKKVIAGCCCFSACFSLSVFKCHSLSMQPNPTPGRNPSCCSNPVSASSCPLCNSNGNCCCMNDKGQCCCNSSGNGDCCEGGGGGGGCDCCEGGGGDGGCDCCEGGGGGGGCDCCKGGGGGGGCDCCKGGGGGGGCDCCKGGGGGGGCDCCKGGGGGGGCDCCKGGGGGGGCDCCKGGGGGRGGCNCCKTEIDGFDYCAPAHLESCNGVLECFLPWNC